MAPVVEAPGLRATPCSPGALLDSQPPHAVALPPSLSKRRPTMLAMLQARPSTCRPKEAV
jgi:hypothetical protein